MDTNLSCQVCSVCLQPRKEFSQRNPLVCKQCYQIAYRKRNQEKKKFYQQLYNRKNRQRFEQYHVEYREEHREKAKQYAYLYREQNPEQIKETKRANYEANKEKLRVSRQSPKGRFQVYKNSARCSGRLFELTFEEFMSFWNQPCFYCGQPIPTIGLDRIDGSRGYSIDNIVSCCFVCNRGRNTMKQEEFIQYLDNLVVFRSKDKNDPI
jgi:hypothetical protein